ncbi:MAG TPA: hypothetical protein VGO67_22850 [Verrucomicrobiae bacterium]|jgi:hypothetical protein
MTTKPALRLSRLIASETGKNGVKLNRLTSLINEANREAGTNCYVNRRMLANIKDKPEKVGLTLNVLVALNTYYRKRGLGLQQLPILETRGVLEPLMDSSRVMFMLGAKPRPEERRNDISLWDTRSQAKLLTQVSKLDVYREFDIEPVLWRTPIDPTAILSERWHRILEEDHASVISIGSPLASLSSEVMLARMFGVEQFTLPRFRAGRQLPFFFVWLPNSIRHFHSAFALTWRELHSEYPALAARVRRNQSSAFILEGTPHGVPAEGKAWTMHGIVAAQRRASGNVWLVVSGLAGPATYGVATMVKEISAELPWSKGKQSKVLWVPVKVKIKGGKTAAWSGDTREVVEAVFDGEPRLWPEDTELAPGKMDGKQSSI